MLKSICIARCLGGSGLSDDGFRSILPDPDAEQTQEWQDSIRAVSNSLGNERARRLLLETLDAANKEGVGIQVTNTPYLNTHATHTYTHLLLSAGP